MEKKQYKLFINESLEHVMPPLQDVELALLEQSLLNEGCRDPLVVWNGTIVDGHNRYRICHKRGIPFEYVEKDFESEFSARLWIVQNQLGRRNLTDFARCELALSYEAELKAEAKERKKRKSSGFVPQNSAEQMKGKETREVLAKIAGVSRDTLMKAKKLANGADDETKDKLRTGEMTINRAYTDMKKKERKCAEGQAEPANEANSATTGTSEVFAENRPKSQSVCVPNNEPALPSTPDVPTAPTPAPAPTHSSPLKLREDWDKQPERNPYEIMPGIDVKRALGSLADIKYERPPDSVYDEEPVEIYGLMPVDNPETRSAAELAYACSELRKGGDYYLQSVRESLQKLSAFSRNEESLGALRQLVDEYYSQIMELLVL